MTRLKTISPTEATGETAKTYGAIKSALGSVPNLFQGLANSPRALNAYLHMGELLKGGVLTGAELEIISLAVGQKNSCEYCVSAHTVLAKMNGLTEQQTVQVRKGTFDDPKKLALIKLVNEIVSEKGHVSDSTLSNFRQQGYTDAHVAEVMLGVAQNIYSNYFNHINKTVVDFPKAPAI